VGYAGQITNENQVRQTSFSGLLGCDDVVVYQLFGQPWCLRLQGEVSGDERKKPA
jgi:hypothetical protein